MRFLVLAFFVLACTAPARADLVWDFSSDAQGWRVTDLHCASSYISVIQVYTVNWVATGGNPGGYIDAIDPANNCYFFDAPSASLGDWSQYNGGTLEFCLKSNVRNWDDDNAVALIGSNGVSLVAHIDPTPYPEWGAYAIQFVPANFRKNGLGGATATAADLAGVLQSVSALRISAEYGAAAHQELVGLDSVRVTSKQVLGIRGAHTAASIAPQSAKRFWFRVWGRASEVAAGSFVLDDGSGRLVRVIAPGHAVTAWQFAVAEGLLDPGTTPPVLSSSAALITVH